MHFPTWSDAYKDKLAYVEWQTNYKLIIISLQIKIMINTDI